MLTAHPICPARNKMDATEIVVPYGKGDAGVPEQKYRDVLKLMMTDGNIAYCILGCEDQGTIHYAMPVKNMLYDAMQLARQVTKAANLSGLFPAVYFYPLSI